MRFPARVILLDPDARPLIGHRGAAGTHPENTVRSFDAALAAGADGLELDVRMTGDGVPVVIHDATLDRTTDRSGPVGDLRAADLESVDAGEGERIPRLAGVLERYPGIPVILEIKEGRAAPAVAAMLRRYGAERRVLVGAFRRSHLGPFRPPAFVRTAARGETAWFWAGTRLGATLPGGYAAFAVPEYYGRLRVVDGRFVAAATRRRKPVHVWTVNAPDTARRLRELGVAGLITDDPARLRSALGS